MEHAVLSGREPLDLLPLKVHPRRDDEAVVLEIAVAQPHPARGGIDGAGRLVHQLHAPPAQTGVVEGEADDGDQLLVTLVEGTLPEAHPQPLGEQPEAGRAR